jgi:DNA-binding PadR family transcriptional regulator
MGPKMKVPVLSHLQFLVLDVLGTQELSGRELRKCLSEHGLKKSGPAFYQLMARLENVKYVEGWYNQEVIDGQIIKERHYKVLGNGARALRDTVKFYESRSREHVLAPCHTAA